MDKIRNPFTPGAGTPPPELAGRAAIIEDATVAIQRCILGKSARSQILLGLRGVGKTVLLLKIAEIAENAGFLPISIEAPEDRTLAKMLVPKLRQTLYTLSRTEKAKDVARKALSVLRAFAGAFKITVSDIEFGINPEPGTADSGDLEADLPELLSAVATTAKADGKAIALFIDEIQYLTGKELGALIVAIHHLNQKQLPFIFFGAGLPQVAKLAGDAKSYAERLFSYPAIGPLSRQALEDALKTPILREGAHIEPKALDLLMKKSQGYPYFVQTWGSHTWNSARTSPIVAADVTNAAPGVLHELDNGFFQVRLDRLTPRERDYVMAMAELGEGSHRSGEIATKIGMEVSAAGALRDGLIKKGMIYSPQHGDTDFTVPMFGEFLLRTSKKATGAQKKTR